MSRIEDDGSHCVSLDQFAADIADVWSRVTTGKMLPWEYASDETKEHFRAVAYHLLNESDAICRCEPAKKEDE